MRGFTLIEIIIYLALLTILIVSATEVLVAVESSVHTSSEEQIVAAEAAFVAAKLDWAYSQTSSTTFSLQGSAIMLSEGTQKSLPITSPNVRATALSITQKSSEVAMTFTLDGHAFSLTEYRP